MRIVKAKCPYCNGSIPVTTRNTFYRHGLPRYRSIACYGSGRPVGKRAFLEEDEVTA